MNKDAGKLDRRIQFQRFTLVDDGFTSVEAWADHGSPVWARRKYKPTLAGVSVRVEANQIASVSTTRFEIRNSAFARGITANDRFVTDGELFEIDDIQPVGRQFIEISGRARIDVSDGVGA